MRKGMRIGLLAVLAASILTVGAASAQAATVRVDANGVGGWSFNPDPSTSTPYEFSTAFESIGAGSLHVLPISGAPANKFIATLPLGTQISDISSLSYDFMIDPAGVVGPTTYKQFYINVYTNLPGSTTFYDCRFDYVPTSGSSSAFTTMSVTPSTVPASKGDHLSGGCPATLGGMPAGSTVSFFAINVGDTGAGDTGVGGYLDNVVVSGTSSSTTYDFEATPADNKECKKNGFAEFGFANQGQCVARSNALAHA